MFAQVLQDLELLAAYCEALKIFVEFQDGRSSGIVLGSLAHLQRASGRDSVFAIAAEMLGVTVDEVRIMMAEPAE
jgi:hypothetical protein